jgi:hypothetical protein
MINRDFPGIPLTWQRIAPADVVKTVAAGVWQYKEYEIGYDSCDFTGGFVEGQVITGATSGAMGVVRSSTLTSGTILSGDAAGKIRFHSWNGINFTNNEKIKVAGDADVGDIDGTAPVACTDNYPFKEAIANGVMVYASTQAQLVAFSGRKVLADQTAKLALIINAGSSIYIDDAAAAKNINVVDAVSGTTGETVFVGYF